MNAVQIRNLHFSYPGKHVISDQSLNIAKGEFVGVVGKTGCGKSTFLLALNGIIPQMIKGDFSGRVEILGQDTGRTPVHTLARSVAFVFQDPDDQIFSLTVKDEVLFGLNNIGIGGEKAEGRVMEALKAVGLEEHIDSDPHTLSYGQKQKLTFACALAVGPGIYVLDEPVSSLDNSSADEIYSMLKKLNKAGSTIIVAEHDTEWLAEYASRILFLNNGKIEADGSPFLLFDKRIREAGLKVPCAVRISQGIRKPMLTPAQVAKYLKLKLK